MDDMYTPLVNLAVRALSSVGIMVDYGAVPGSYCDGRYSLCVRGKKIGGTAALVRRRNGWRGNIAHAYLTVWGTPADDVEAIRRIEAALGFAPDYIDQVHTSVICEFGEFR